MKFYTTLFNEGEGVCWSIDCYGTAVYPVESWEAYQGAPFFCINPLHLGLDNAPTRNYHSPKLGRRADVNVTTYRNILVEFDSMPLNDQAAYVAKIKMPYTSVVYSGGKSFHFIISLETPLADREDYRELVSALHKKLEHSDITASNPSRLSRSPNAIRDNGRPQTLIELGSRVPLDEFKTWLGPIEVPIRAITLTPRVGEVRMLNKFTEYFLKYGAEEGKWNAALFKAVCDMTRCGLTRDEIEVKLLGITGVLDSKDKSTMDSAIRQAEYDLRTRASRKAVQP